jgi:hypothetical protein
LRLVGGTSEQSDVDRISNKVIAIVGTADRKIFLPTRIRKYRRRETAARDVVLHDDSESVSKPPGLKVGHTAPLVL